MAKNPVCETQYYYVGATIDERYRLVDFIGVGGMACVYKAQESGSPHTYAVKFLKTEYHNQAYLIEYFRDEASSMRDLAHPNIVRFYRFVNKSDYSYIVMDYVDGFALSDIIKRMYKRGEEIPLDEVMRIMTQVARALDAIHREGYVHRDIKPSNVLIERNTGQTFLTDLGITTASNTRMEGAGTLAYMPPEMMETWIADHRADVYSYGIMFFEMLAKQRPFRVESGLKGKDAEEDLKDKHKYAPIPNITDYRPDLPKELNQIMQKALAKKPDERYNNIIELTQEIHRVLKPKLSADMQEFSTITHRFIDAPDQMTGPVTVITANPQQNWLIYMALAVGVVAIALAWLITSTALFNPTNNQTDTPSVTQTPTSTRTPFYTPTPNPLADQAVYLLVENQAALAELSSLSIPQAEDSSLQYLRVGLVDGFRVAYQLKTYEGVSRYGIAFRLQDSQNYQRFTIDSSSMEWQFADVVNGDVTVQKTGTLESIPLTLALTGREDFFQVEVGTVTVDYVSSLFAAGSLALYVEGTGILELENLQISLIGDEALAAAANRPTPAAGLADPHRFLKADLLALLATNDVLNSAIDCPPYIRVYESLERHLESANTNVRVLAQETIDAGALVYSRCRSENPDGALNFLTAIQDYLAWEDALRRIQGELD